MIPLYDNNPTRRIPFLTIAFITINVFVFGLQLKAGPHFQRFILQYGAIPFEIMNSVDIYPPNPFPVQSSLISSMFMHGGLFHLLGNMLFLWIFGNNVEDIQSPLRFIVFYILCGLVAAFSHILQNVDSHVPMVGASGAVSGILAAYVLAFPRARVHTLFWFFIFIRVIPLPAWIVIGMWFLVQISNVGAPGQVAWGAHVGGFMAGLILAPFFRKRKA